MGQRPVPRHAIVLAAGMGARLRSVVDDRPKGLIEIEGETLVGRSVGLLRASGIEQITIVIGYLGEHYERFASGQPDIRLLRNRSFETTGSMASLAVALDDVRDPVLILESDLAYEARALSTLLDGRAEDATLLSGPTGAGDEVWVDAFGGAVHAMSKERSALDHVTGEFVGITRLSSAGGAALRGAFSRFTERHGHGRMDYETGGLVEVAQTLSLAAALVPDLCWGEIDDDRQLDRVAGQVWPRVTRGLRNV